MAFKIAKEKFASSQNSLASFMQLPVLIPKTTSMLKNYSLDSECGTLYIACNRIGTAKTAGFVCPLPAAHSALNGNGRV
jgi:hypothetical protein